MKKLKTMLKKLLLTSMLLVNSANLPATNTNTTGQNNGNDALVTWCGCSFLSAISTETIVRSRTGNSGIKTLNDYTPECATANWVLSAIATAKLKTLPALATSCICGLVIGETINQITKSQNKARFIISLNVKPDAYFLPLRKLANKPVLNIAGQTPKDYLKEIDYFYNNQKYPRIAAYYDLLEVKTKATKMKNQLAAVNWLIHNVSDERLEAQNLLDNLEIRIKCLQDDPAFAKNLELYEKTKNHA